MTMPEEIAVTPSPAGRWQSLALGTLWLGFVTYAVLFSPSSTPDTIEVIRQLSTGQWALLNPLVVVLFNLMGLWPLVYAGLALSDGCEQSIPAWPFVVGSFGFGAFALMPYMALRKPTCHLPQRLPDTALLKRLNHRWLGWIVVAATLALVIYGVAQGHLSETWQDFCYQFSSSQFIHVMSLDFCMLTLLTPRLLWDDIVRRQAAPGWRAASLVPLVGPALYLALRPSAECL